MTGMGSLRRCRPTVLVSPNAPKLAPNVEQRALYSSRSRYAPALRFSASPTPAATLDRAAAIGRRAGLHYVYVGNVPGHRAADTRCPGCGALLVRRHGFAVVANVVVDGACPRCGWRIAGVGWGRAS